MKGFLILTFLALSLCDEPTLGGWTKESTRSNDANIYRAFQISASDYSKSNKNPDNLRMLTVYSQLVNGEKYKMCFVDTAEKIPAIYEYIVYKKLPTEEKTDTKFELSKSSIYHSKNGLIKFDDEEFTKVEIGLKKTLSKITVPTIKFINFVYSIETDETIFYFIRATTSNGQENYVLPKDKKLNEFEFPSLLYN